MKQRQQVFKVIYDYYPQGIDSTDPEYADTAEYQNRKDKCDAARKDIKRRSELCRNLRKIFSNCHVTDYTDTDEFCSFEFLILLLRFQPVLDNDLELQEQLGGKKKELHIFFSNLAPYCYYYILTTGYSREQDSWSFEKSYEVPAEFHNEMRELMCFFEKEGYELIDVNNADLIVDDVSTKLLDIGNARVFHCLFSDLFTLETGRLFE